MNTNTVPALTNESCAFDSEHTLPEQVLIYGNLPAFLPRGMANVVCNADCEQGLTDQMVG